MWSTVEIQPRSPGFVAQIRSSERARGEFVVRADDLRDAIVFGGGQGLLPHFSVTRNDRMLARSGPDSSGSGMSEPGFRLCGLAIQPDKKPGLFGSSPPAMVVRDIRWVRSGPTWPLAGVPRTVWQAPQRPMKRCSPRRVSSEFG